MKDIKWALKQLNVRFKESGQQFGAIEIKKVGQTFLTAKLTKSLSHRYSQNALLTFLRQLIIFLQVIM